MTRDDYETLARETASLARAEIRDQFQVNHPHYTPPPGCPFENMHVAHAVAKAAFALEGQTYDRAAVWAAVIR